MSRRAESLHPAYQLAVRAGVALALANCTATNGCRREPAPGPFAETMATLHDEAVRPIACPRRLLAARRGGSDPDRYLVPNSAERSAMAELVAQLVAQAATPTAAARAAAFGYRVEDVPEIPGALLLSELDTRRRGGGAYLLRPGAVSRVVVQAPHTFFDEGTLSLACELFQRASARALFIDTAHRYKAAAIDEHGNHPADIAHAKESLFQAATEGVLRAVPDASVVQMHGFGPRDQSDAAVVLSSGVAELNGALVAHAQQLLATIALGPVLRFPEQTSELGAITNVQGELVRNAGGRFLHVELAASLRKALLDDAELRARFLDALAGSCAPP